MASPAYRSVPSFVKTYGPEVADLAAMAGYAPDEAQRDALDAIFACGADNRAAALEVALIAGRQNIKTSVFKMAVLGWLFVTDQKLITWSAHEFPRAAEAHRELAELIEGCPELCRRLKATYWGAGDKAIELLSGQRVQFKARTNTGGRGLSGDRMVLDEAFALTPTHIGALFPTLSARPDPQLVYGSSAGLVQSDILRAVRDRGRAGDDPRLAYIEYCDDLGGDCAEPDCDHAVTRTGCRLDDEERWKRANPALGTRISLEYVRAERRAMPAEEFARERLGWWDEADDHQTVFAPGVWESRRQPGSQAADPVTFAVEVAPDRDWACIAVADRTGHVECVDYRRGTGWVTERARQLADRHHAAAFVVQPSSPAGSLLDDLADTVRVIRPTGLEYAQACGDFFDAVVEGRIRHLGQPALDVAVANAKRKPYGDAWVWDRRRSLDVSPVPCVTLAYWGANRKPAKPGRLVWF